MSSILPFSIDAQVTLKKNPDPNKQGYESIVFEKVIGENSDGSDKIEISEYGIQANNPHNNLPLNIKSVKKDGSNSYRIGLQDESFVSSYFESIAHPIESASELHSNVQLSMYGEFVIIAYNAYLSYEGGDVHPNVRKSEIRLINSEGYVENIHQVLSDAQSLVVSPDGNYFAYAYGSPMHSSKPKTYGFRIIESKSSKIIIDLENILVTSSYIQHGYLGLSGSGVSGNKKWLLDYSTGYLYEIDGDLLIKGRSSLKSLDGNRTIDNLESFRIK